MKFKNFEGEALTDNFSNVVEYIANELAPYKLKRADNTNISSYTLKHIVENNIGNGEYISNLDVKVACELLQIPRTKISNRNVNLGISKKVLKCLH